METVEYKNISFTVWDVGGQDKVCICQFFFFFFSFLPDHGKHLEFHYVAKSASLTVTRIPKFKKPHLYGHVNLSTFPFCRSVHYGGIISRTPRALSLLLTAMIVIVLLKQGMNYTGC